MQAQAKAILANKPFQAVVGAILLLLLVYWLGRRSWRKEAPKDVKLPSDIQGEGTPTNWNPGAYTDALRNELYGWGLRSAKPYNDVLALSNSQVVAIHNDWNRRYHYEYKETLRQAIEKEKTVWNYSWVTAAGALIDRLKSLGL
jgi:hypothetical protein